MQLQISHLTVKTNTSALSRPREKQQLKQEEENDLYSWMDFCTYAKVSENAVFKVKAAKHSLFDWYVINHWLLII